MISINEQWTTAFNDRNLQAMLDLYEADATLVPQPGAPPVSGLAAIEENLRYLLSLDARVSYQPRFWLEQGDLALGSIEFHIIGTDGSGNPIDLRGATSEVVRRQPDGTWKYVFDHPFAGAPGRP
jgi:ketosteroid isomerase-like protein